MLILQYFFIFVDFIIFKYFRWCLYLSLSLMVSKYIFTILIILHILEIFINLLIFVTFFVISVWEGSHF